MSDTAKGQHLPKHRMSAADAYRQSMVIIRNRFLSASEAVSHETPLQRAERLALHVRKIVEGVAFAALSGVEFRNRQLLSEQRTQDADKLLRWLERKGLLRLPQAQRLGKPTDGFDIVFEGGEGAAAGFDLSAATLLEMFSRASSLVHERHPERLTQAQVGEELSALEADVQSLRNWLWLHIMFFKDGGFLLQMGQFGTESFMAPIEKKSDYPAR